MTKTKGIKKLSSFDNLDDFCKDPSSYQVIKLKNKAINAAEFNKFTTALKKHHGKLTDIILVNLGLSDEMASAICASLALRKSPSYPRVLNLNSNELTDGCLKSVFNVCKYVSILSLEHNSFGEGAVFFKGVMLSTAVKLIKLAGNRIPAEECNAIRSIDCFDRIVHTKSQKEVDDIVIFTGEGKVLVSELE